MMAHKGTTGSLAPEGELVRRSRASEGAHGNAGDGGRESQPRETASGVVAWRGSSGTGRIRTLHTFVIRSHVGVVFCCSPELSARVSYPVTGGRAHRLIDAADTG